MRQIRHSVFETNSSSTHSITIKHKGLGNNSMKVQDDGYIHTALGEFGWEIADYRSQEDRLSYLVTMLAEKHGFNTIWCDDETAAERISDLMKTKDFKQLSDEVGNYARCRGVIIDNSQGYIDHQSHEYYNTLNDFLREYRTDIVEFVFGRGNIVHTDNDNY